MSLGMVVFGCELFCAGGVIGRGEVGGPLGVAQAVERLGRITTITYGLELVVWRPDEVVSWQKISIISQARTETQTLTLKSLSCHPGSRYAYAQKACRIQSCHWQQLRSAVHYIGVNCRQIMDMCNEDKSAFLTCCML